MTVERVFLGWDGAALPRAAAWLGERYGERLGSVTAALPTRRSGRRLVELLVAAGGGVATPPRVLTAGGLVDALCGGAAGEAGGGVASESARRWAWVEALRGVESGVLAAVLGDRPASVSAWVGLAGELMAAGDVLGGAGVAWGEVAVQAGPDSARWAALALVHERYVEALSSMGWADPHAARWAAVGGGAVGAWDAAGSPAAGVVLIGVVEVTGVLRAALDVLVAGGVPVVALVGAPGDEAGAFDGYGGVVPEAWGARRIAWEDSDWVVADRPGDQAAAAVRVIAGWASGESGGADAGGVVVGVGDASLGGSVARALALAGGVGHVAEGRAVAQSRPATLVRAAGAYLESRRFDAFAALVRHADAPLPALPVGGDEAGAGGGLRGGWLTLLDRYATGRLPRTTAGLRGRGGAALQGLVDAVDAWLPGGAGGAAEVDGLPGWADAWSAALRAAYGGVELRSGRDDALIESLQRVGQELAVWRGLPGESPRLRAHESAAWLVQSLTEDTAGPPASADAVEVLGFLELPLDDAPRCVLCGVNEGTLPGRGAVDAWLPEALRRGLGLPGRSSREARDAYALTVVLRSRETTLVSGRATADGDPLLPSRLVLRDEPGVVAARVARFYDDARVLGGLPRLASGVGVTTLARPAVEEGLALPRRLSVTAFKDYLACPYRFYLKHVLGLGGLDDEALELDAAGFGTLAHRVLEAFGRGSGAASTSRRVVAKELDERLDAAVREWFGASPAKVVQLQAALLRERLGAFAGWQAAQARDGWRVRAESLEQKHTAALPVDGEAFEVHGKIDRIDEHEELGLRVIDYKAGNRPKEADASMRAGDAWLDLQLPLYRLLATTAFDRPVHQLGYVRVSAKAEAPVWDPLRTLDDSAYADALRAAAGVVRRVRAGAFGELGADSGFDDGFRHLLYLDTQALPEGDGGGDGDGGGGEP